MRREGVVGHLETPWRGGIDRPKTVRILKVKPESVRIRLVEMEPWDLANAGELECDRRGIDIPEGVRAPMAKD